VATELEIDLASRLLTKFVLREIYEGFNLSVDETVDVVSAVTMALIVTRDDWSKRTNGVSRMPR
jgi:hypothetical protein